VKRLFTCSRRISDLRFKIWKDRRAGGNRKLRVFFYWFFTAKVDFFFPKACGRFRENGHEEIIVILFLIDHSIRKVKHSFVLTVWEKKWYFHLHWFLFVPQFHFFRRNFQILSPIGAKSIWSFQTLGSPIILLGSNYVKARPSSLHIILASKWGLGLRKALVENLQNTCLERLGASDSSRLENPGFWLKDEITFETIP